MLVCYALYPYVLHFLLSVRPPTLYADVPVVDEPNVVSRNAVRNPVLTSTTSIPKEIATRLVS